MKHVRECAAEVGTCTQGELREERQQAPSRDFGIGLVAKEMRDMRTVGKRLVAPP